MRQLLSNLKKCWVSRENCISSVSFPELFVLLEKGSSLLILKWTKSLHFSGLTLEQAPPLNVALEMLPDLNNS